MEALKLSGRLVVDLEAKHVLDSMLRYAIKRVIPSGQQDASQFIGLLRFAESEVAVQYWARAVNINDLGEREVCVQGVIGYLDELIPDEVLKSYEVKFAFVSPSGSQFALIKKQ